MAKKYKKQKKEVRAPRISGRFSLPQEVKQIIFGILMLLLAIITSLSFFNASGKIGNLFLQFSRFLAGEAVFAIPVIFLLAGIVFLMRRQEGGFFKKDSAAFFPVILASALLIFGVTGILGIFNPASKKGGMFGYALSWLVLRYAGFWVALAVFSAIIAIGFLIFKLAVGHIFSFDKKEQKEEEGEEEEGQQELIPKPSLFEKIFAPKFKISEVPSAILKEQKIQEDHPILKPESKTGPSHSKIYSYKLPPLDLLEPDHDVPLSGDTKVNQAIIKRTFQNFGIEVAMTDVCVGPTVAQYSLKPAEGVKLSKITALTNDLALALASHPIRIEAPIPGKSLVGIEIPNKTRAQVRLRGLIEDAGFQKSLANLVLPMGKDVAGFPVYIDLTKMPHMLVAGSTGTGKTVFLNNLIMSLLYQPSTASKNAGPETLRLIMIDPKRVEFPIYNNLPHLLCPVVCDPQKAVLVFKWLTKEMERRFDVLANAKTRDIGGYNEQALRNKEVPLPFIVVVVDELADLMSSKGREIEGTIVRLAQMARAVGIHLVLATQRPSVEVITGLIKANITTRVTFQVASQIDSRTVLDTSGAERLLGGGDMLFISANTSKPKRVQGAYVSEKEVKRVVKYIEDQAEETGQVQEMDEGLMGELERFSGNGDEFDFGSGSGSGSGQNYFDVGGGNENGEDILYDEARRCVLESKRASASLLQRRLRIGYARAARLLDILEDRGVVGPAEGAKPREVYGAQTKFNIDSIPMPESLDEKVEEKNEEIKEEESPEEESGDENNNKGEWEKI